MKTCNCTIEFWERASGCLTTLKTEAAPPPVGALINIRGQDWQVADVDYSIDRAGDPLDPTYRRNVYVVRPE